jgi:acyl carrier protein
MNTQIPKGIEVLVKKASVDPAFKALLLERRAGAAQEIGLELDTAETMMLTAVPAGQLEAIIARTDVPQEHRRAFLGHAAAAMLAAVGTVATAAPAWGGSLGCKPGGASGGMRMDRPDDKPPKEEPKPQPKRPGTIEERVSDLVAQQFKVDKKTITRKTSLADDLKAGFSAQVRLKKELEREFDVKIPGPEFKKLGNIGQIIDYVENAPEEPPSAPADRHPPVSRGIGIF